MKTPDNEHSVASQARRRRTAVPPRILCVALALVSGLGSFSGSGFLLPAQAHAQVQAQTHAQAHARAQTTVPTPATPAEKLVSLGDSITFGYNLGNNWAPSPKAFPTLVAHMWAKQSHRLWQAENLGVPGWTSTNLLHALATPRFQRALRLANCVTLDIGSNDLLEATPALLRVAANAATGKSKPTTIATIPPQTKRALARAVTRYARNLPAIITAIRKQTAAPIILVTLYDPIPDNNPVHPAAETAIAAINQIIYETAAANQIVTADAYSVITHRQNTLIRVAELDIHPTVLGQKVLANAVVNATSNPLWNTPMAYAIAANTAKGAIIRVSPSSASNTLWWLHGWQGVLVTSDTPGWYGVTTPDGRSGYLSAKSATLLLRPWSNLSFQTQQLKLQPLQVKFPAGSHSGGGAIGFIVKGTDYLSIGAVRAMIQGPVTWNVGKREISIMLTTTQPFTKVGVAGGTSTRGILTSAAPHQARTAMVTSAGMELTINGEPIRLAHEPLLIHGIPYVPVTEVWQALGGHVARVTHGTGGQPTLSLRGS